MKKTIEDFWKLKKFTPTDSQRDAILHADGPLFLTAGPGSGKTRVLLWRTLNLIAFHNVDPKEIFLSTFTEKAALQLKEGLKSLLALVSNDLNKSFDISKMSIGTVHSICNALLLDRRFSDGQRKRPPVIMDQLSQYFHIYQKSKWRKFIEVGGYDNEEIAQREINVFLSGRNASSRHLAVTNCISLFNRFSEECINTKSIKTTDVVLLKLIKMYDYYLSTLIKGKTKLADLSLLQQFAYERIKEVKNSINVFKHIIIDEYQDTNTIQEMIFFELAKGNKNICVVGDDDQALYRFRGATVENLVEFSNRCEKYLKIKPKRIDLVTNFRSKKKIVEHYTSFIDKIDWKKEKPHKGHHRVINKKIEANSNDKLDSVIVSSHDDADKVCTQIAKFVKKLKEEDKITDYNQVAFLFPSVKSRTGPATRIKQHMEAFDKEKIPYYAPRAGRFLEVEESMAVFGIFLKIFDRPHYGAASGGLVQFRNWMVKCMSFAGSLIKEDKFLKKYVDDRKSEISILMNDYEALMYQVKRMKWNIEDDYLIDKRAVLIKTPGLSEKAKKSISGHFFNRFVEQRIKDNKPLKLKYVINRATALDWSVLDLFYQINGFKYFVEIYDKAARKNKPDEGPICNLGLITQYLARFLDEYPPIITAQFLNESKFVNTFFTSFIYALYRLQESEYEDADNPFPKGRVPFLTIHQAKGLEFPVVVLGSVFKQNFGASKIEHIIKEIIKRDGEPLHRIGEFDLMRMFYVGLSRAQNLLVLPRYKKGKAACEAFKTMFKENNFTEISNFKIDNLEKIKPDEEDLGKTYSFTSDFLQYKKCARQYMIFRKYGFVPSRSQTMFFGSLVHETIEDLHNLLINQKSK